MFFTETGQLVFTGKVAFILLSSHILGLLAWIKLLDMFGNFRDTVKVKKKKPKEKVLHKEESFPFDEGDPLDWYGINLIPEEE